MKKISESATTKTTISNKEKERKDMKRVERNFNLAEEQKVCNVVISYDCDMRPLYELLLSKCGKDMPTLVVLEKLPDEFIKTGFAFVSSSDNQNKLILLLAKSDNIKMQSVLLEAIDAYKNKNSLEFGNVYYQNIRIDEITHLAHNDYMYGHALKIVSMLRIPCPQIVMKKTEVMDENVNGFVEHLTKNDVQIGSIVYLKKGGGVFQLRTLAHELRHCWQQKYGSKMKVFISTNAQNSDEYRYNEREVDAEAFSCQYVKESKGYADIMQLLHYTGDHKYIQTIKRRMEEIKLAA